MAEKDLDINVKHVERGSGNLENDNSEGRSCSQKASLLFHHSFVDHYHEAFTTASYVYLLNILG
jgi:hypothetical protein